MTDVRDPSSHVEQEVGPSGQQEVDEEGLVSRDLIVNYDYGLEEDRSLRLGSDHVIAPLHLLTRHGPQRRNVHKTSANMRTSRRKKPQPGMFWF